MRNKYILITAAAVVLTGLAAFSFAGNTNGDDDKKKKKIEKKIEVTDKNGQKTVTVETSENGKTTKQVYTGEEAEKFLKEQHSGIHEGGTGNKVIKMKIDCDDSSGKKDDMIFMYDFDFDFSGEDIQKSMEKLKKELEESGVKLEMELEKMAECMKGSGAYAYAFSFDDENFGKEMDSLMKDIDIDVKVFCDDASEKHDKKVIVKKIIIVEDNKDTKVKNDLKTEDVKLYPNPADDSFMLEFDLPTEEKAKISITDINGKTVLTENVSGAKKYKKQLNTSAVPAGTYILNIQQSGKNISKKVVIE